MKRMQIVTVLGTAAIAMAGSHAYTAGFLGTGIPTSTIIASGSTAVTGATANSVAYTYNASKSQVASITLIVAEDTSAQHLFVTPTVSGTAGTAVDCGLGTFTTTTSYSCTVSGLPWALSTLTAVGFAITA